MPVIMPSRNVTAQQPTATDCASVAVVADHRKYQPAGSRKLSVCPAVAVPDA
jgi:hypothetical protein